MPVPAQPVKHGPSGSQPVCRVLIDRSTKCAPSLSIVARELLGHVAGSGVAGCSTPGRLGPPHRPRADGRDGGRVGAGPPVAFTAATRSSRRDNSTGRERRDAQTPCPVRRWQEADRYPDAMASLEAVINEMTSLEVVVVMAGVPLAIMVLIGLLTLRPHFTRARRWRPDQEWNHRPVLFTTKPEVLREASGAHRETGETRGGAQGTW